MVVERGWSSEAETSRDQHKQDKETRRRGDKETGRQGEKSRNEQWWSSVAETNISRTRRQGDGETRRRGDKGKKAGKTVVVERFR